MESVNNENQFQDLNDNKIIGKPKLSNSAINFSGKGNVLYCENNVKLINSSIRFGGNNSLVYLSTTESQYPLDLQIFQDSVIYIGKNNSFVSRLNLNVQEYQNLIIGDDGIIGNNTTIRTSDAHPIFDINTKKRFNHSQSVYIGDHVWLGQSTYIGKGAKIGSGCILENNTCADGRDFLKSNNLYKGNPCQLVKEDVFFINVYVGGFTAEDSQSVEDYASRIYFYSFKKGETLSPEKLDEILSNLTVDEKIDFIQKLFIQNKKHDRFSI